MNHERPHHRDPRRPGTPVELIDSIVACDGRTRRALRLILTSSGAATMILLGASIAGGSLALLCAIPLVLLGPALRRGGAS